MAGHRPRCTGPGRTGDGCRMLAVPGQLLCGKCGPRGDVVRRQIAQSLAEKYAAQLGVMVDPEDPYEAVATALRVNRSMVAEAGAVVLERGISEMRYTDDNGAEQVRAELVYLEKFTRNLADLGIAAIRAKLDERRLQLADFGGAAYAAVLEDLMDAAVAKIAELGGQTMADELRTEIIEQVPTILARHAGQAARQLPPAS